MTLSEPLRGAVPRRFTLIALAIACSFTLGKANLAAQSTASWKSGAASGYWADPANWSPAAPGATNILIFNTSARGITTNNLTGPATNQHRLIFSGDCGARTNNGSSLGLVSYNGIAPVIECSSPTNIVFNLGFSLAASAIISNCESSSLVFNGTNEVRTNLMTVWTEGVVSMTGMTKSTVGGGKIAKEGAGQLTLSGSVNNAGVGAVVNSGTLVLAKTSDFSTHALDGYISIAEGATLKLGGTGGDQINQGSLVSLTGGTFDLGGTIEYVDAIGGWGLITNGAASSATLYLGQNGSNSTFCGSIVDGGAGRQLSVRKTAGGTLTLAGNNRYSGLTSVADTGTLITYTGNSGSGDYSFNNSTLVIIRNGPDSSISMRDLTLTGFLRIDMAGQPFPTNPIITTRNISGSGDVKMVGGICETGKIWLIRYAKYTDGAFTLTGGLSPGVSGYLTNDTTTSNLFVVITSVAPLYWTGGASAAWAASVANWKSGAFYTENTNGGNAVIFDDTLTSVNTNVQLTGPVSPVRWNVNCTNKNYAFVGAGRISGSANLIKNGPGKVTIGTSNDFAGDTIVLGGTLEITNRFALGSTNRGTFVTPGATLQLSNHLVVSSEPLTLSGSGLASVGALRSVSGSNTWSGGISLTGSSARITVNAGALSLPSNISGPGTALELVSTGALTIAGSVTAGELTKEGPGELLLSGNNLFSGTISLLNGALELNGTNSGGNLLEVDSAAALTGKGEHSGPVEIHGRLSPGAGVGAFRSGPQTWHGGGTCEIEINNSATGGDLVQVAGGIDLQANAGSPFTVDLVSVHQNGEPGYLAGFDKDATMAWPIAALSGNVTNFNMSGLILETARFSNDLGGGFFLLETNGSLNVRFTNNHPPKANPVALTRASGTCLKIAVASLLTDFTSDADGDPRELLSFSAAAAGGTVTREGGWLFYTPSGQDNDDSFTYTVRDARSYRPGDTERTANGTISITTVRSATVAQQITVSGGAVSMTFAGIPGYVYDIERSIDLNGWEVIKSVTNPETGVFTFTDDSPPPDAAYYRLRQH